MGDARAIVDAAYTGNLEAVRRLVQRDRGLLDADDGSWTPLRAAAWRGRGDVIRYLLEEGAEIGLQGPDGRDILEMACCRGHLEAASLLLAHGADAGAAGPVCGMTPLMAACQQGHTNIVALLLTHGCGDVDQQSRVGLAALHYACNKGYAGVW
jgi:ankyrin repeat protein